MRTCRQHSYTYFNLNIFVDSAGDRVQDLAYTRQVSPVSHPKPIPIFFTFPALKSCPTLPSWLFALWRAQLNPDKNTQLPVCHVPVTPRLSQTRTELPPILCPQGWQIPSLFSNPAHLDSPSHFPALLQDSSEGHRTLAVLAVPQNALTALQETLPAGPGLCAIGWNVRAQETLLLSPCPLLLGTRRRTGATLCFTVPWQPIWVFCVESREPQTWHRARAHQRYLSKFLITCQTEVWQQPQKRATDGET